MRAFVAVAVPPEVTEILAALERPSFDHLRWTTPEQWHVTLRFLGEIPDLDPVRNALASVPEALARASLSPAHRAPGSHGAPGSPGAPGEDDGLEVEGIEAILGPVTAWFPGRRVLHVSVGGLSALAKAVADALEPVSDGDGRERPFVGHLTLARVRGERPGPGRLAGIPVHASWLVTHVALVESTLGPGGARYETRAVVALAG
ncbi:MAG TPA: 2'-5' RNA ligase family protein [Acidimicrobiales bacterium]|nr:2'-5' RNA ligase family protein [Acidimicrobiales bacterium]